MLIIRRSQLFDFSTYDADPLQRCTLGDSALFEAVNGKTEEEGMKVLLASIKPDSSLVDELLQ